MNAKEKVNFLHRRGYTNHDWDYTDLVAPQKKKHLIALCTSLRCNGSNANRGILVAKEKIIDDKCPCGNYVRWKQVTQEELDNYKRG